MQKKIKFLFATIIFIISISIVGVNAATEEYNPQINPEDFSTNITNKYFSLPVGLELTYEGQTEDGLEKIVIKIPGDKKTIMDIETLVYWDRVWLDGELIEDTRDYLAQDEEGNVWYFGEDVDNYEDGALVDHEGSWSAGEDGAKPGIWMMADPQVGDSYRQEYLVGEAEDMADVLSTSETVTVPYGTFTNCLKTYDWTPLDAESKEHKYYCPQISSLVLEVNTLSDEKVELIDINGGKPFPDVPVDHENVDAIEFAFTNGIVNGFSDGDFKPEQGSTRGEFTKILINYKFTPAEINACDKYTLDFPDVASDDKFVQYICIAKQENIVDGFSDGTYKPGQKITTEEGLKIIANTYGLVDDPESDTDDIFKPFTSAIADKKALPGDSKLTKETFERGTLVEVLYRLEENIMDKESITYEQFSD